MDEKYLLELEVQGAVEMFLSKIDSNDSFAYQSLKDGYHYSTYAQISEHARKVISEERKKMYEGENAGFTDFQEDEYASEFLMVEKSKKGNVVAEEIETQAAVRAFFEKGDTRGCRFLGEEDFFKAYTMLCYKARKILAEARDNIFNKEQLEEEYFSYTFANESRYNLNPVTPSTELEVASAVRFYMNTSNHNYKLLDEEDFFRMYALNSYEARKEIDKAKDSSPIKEIEITSLFDDDAIGLTIEFRDI